MPYRPLAIVSGLTIGDYLLWNWSLNANHDAFALVSGLTLPPLAIACLWLIALTAARLLALTTRGASRASRGRRSSRVPAAARQAPVAAPKPAAERAASASSARSSRKIAA